MEVVDDWINSYLKTKETEFLQAYKNHIAEVQEEVDQMKDKADDFKEITQLSGQESQQKIEQLKEKAGIDNVNNQIESFSQFARAKLDYYKRATTYLGAHTQQQHKKVSVLKKQIDVKEDDHKFYEAQIK